MNKLILTFLIVINLISIYQCLGITNYTKLGNYYIINIASEDITNFKNKLNSNLHSIKNEFSLIIIKVFLRTVALYILFISIILFIRKTISIKFYTISFFIISICDIYYINNTWNNYKFGIKSAGNAIITLDLAMKNQYSVDPRKSNFIEHKYKIDYLSNEIEKYGIHAIFCEIPGTLPSNNANPLSFSYSNGIGCYNYDSQRRFLDPEAYNYVGDEESQKYRTIQINKTFDLF